MITQSGRPTNTLQCVRVALATLLLVGTGACGDDGNPVDPNERLCGGETGIGLLIEGRAEPLEFCVDDADVPVILTQFNRYDVEAHVANNDGTFVIRMVFAVQSAPVDLRVTDSLSEATSDPSAVWIYYEEVPVGGDPIESFVVDDGSFRLTFVDEDVAAGVLSGVAFQMRDVTTGDPAGTRQFSDGMFSISVKEPTVISSPLMSAR
jgi:hypothetical protein